MLFHPFPSPLAGLSANPFGNTRILMEKSTYTKVCEYLTQLIAGLDEYSSVLNGEEDISLTPLDYLKYAEMESSIPGPAHSYNPSAIDLIRESLEQLSKNPELKEISKKKLEDPLLRLQWTLYPMPIGYIPFVPDELEKFNQQLTQTFWEGDVRFKNGTSNFVPTGENITKVREYAMEAYSKCAERLKRCK
jgi:hypothetical protein